MRETWAWRCVFSTTCPFSTTFNSVYHSGPSETSSEVTKPNTGRRMSQIWFDKAQNSRVRPQQGTRVPGRGGPVAPSAVNVLQFVQQILMRPLSVGEPRSCLWGFVWWATQPRKDVVKKHLSLTHAHSQNERLMRWAKWLCAGQRMRMATD